MKILRSLTWIVPVSLLSGLALSLLDGGTWWIGWISYGVLFTLGLLSLKVLFPVEKLSSRIFWILLLALLLRLGLGVSFSYILPAFGYDSVSHQAGHIFNDSYQRDHQAWEIASSDVPLWQAFNKSYSSDQYGGMLFLSGVTYRYLSPEIHRPWLMILLAAMTAAIGIGLAFRAARASWGEKAAYVIAWILALYPESILLGSALMREPFLMTFLAMMFQGLLIWKENRWKSLAWALAGVLGLLMFSPGVAAVGVLTFCVWIWLSSREFRIRWWQVLGVVVIIGAALLLLSTAVRSSLAVSGGPLENLFDWLRLSAQWDVYLLETQSGWLENIFHSLPTGFHLPFMIMYGLTQPLLPAAIADPGAPPLRILNILRGLGWYALLPFLVYSLWSVIKLPARREKTAWLWLWLVSWGWIILSSFRAGGDQWDNPRYRVIFLLFQAALCAQAWLWQRASRDRWLGRILSMEAVFLLAFGYWYAARYTGWEAGQVHVFIIIALVIVLSVMIIMGGVIADRKRVRRA